jgi:uncharacterized protein (DUF1330 family)
MAAVTTVADHGGKFTVRATILDTLAGAGDFDRFVLIEFPEADSARARYQNAAYQALIANRDETVEMLFSLAETA